jgi:saccharopine dehydrogenase-like NADP-dependent oxidoreductase
MEIEEVVCMVGGLPRIRKFPFEYKAPFSPVDVIEEYTRPARYVENGNIVVKPALSDAEYINFDSVGTLEAFNTDGLRSLIYTMKHIPNMKEKTLRYPGHINLIMALKESGFFSREPIVVGGIPVMPFDYTSKVLFNVWKSDVDEPEFTVMKITLRGIEKGVRKEIIYDLYDEFDSKTRISSMGRTTGFTATGTAEMIINNLFNEKGVFPPEVVGKNPVCFDFILNYLYERNVQFVITEQNI